MRKPRKERSREVYRKKLLDPRWQKKRLEIFARDDWQCQTCGETERTLHVHHLRYDKGVEPWESDTHCLLTVCETCHERETAALKGMRTTIMKILFEYPWTAQGLSGLYYCIEASMYPILQSDTLPTPQQLTALGEILLNVAPEIPPLCIKALRQLEEGDETHQSSERETHRDS